MNYSSSLRYLNSFLNLERIIYHPHNHRWNLRRMKILLKWFQHPEKSFFPVLIAGTKGKGSTGFFLESILAASGVSVGFYSSPHLEDPRERIRLQGLMIPQSQWVEGLKQIRQILARHTLPASWGDFTYFEIMTLLAMLVFQKEKIQIGLFEVGMGGRLDATNVLNTRLEILTPVYLDHEAFLGNTIARIAREKAAIIRPRADVVVSPQKEEAMRVIREEIKKKKARAWGIAPINRYRKLGLKGDYQRVNAGAALKAALILRDKYSYPVSDKAIAKGLQADRWPGRFEVFKGNPSFLLDGAHNPSSIEAFVKNFERLFPNRPRLLIFGTSRDKKSGEMLKILGGHFSQVILTPTANPRTQEISVLLTQARGPFHEIYPVSGLSEALTLARKLANPQTLVVITGSFYLIGEARTIIQKLKGKNQKGNAR